MYMYVICILYSMLKYNEYNKNIKICIYIVLLLLLLYKYKC